jgi:hypothetical protein
MSMIPISPVDIYEGNNVTFYTSSTPKVGSSPGAFLTTTGMPIDPDIVEFSYIVQGMEPNVFIYTQGSGDPTDTIIRVSTGEYQATIPTTNQVGRWIWRWSGYPAPEDTTNTYAAAVEGVINVLGNDVDQSY